MRVLLDNNLDHRFAALLEGHDVTPARRLGWAALSNGDLIAAAEREGFDALVTGDKNLRYQQNLKGRRISVIVLDSLFVDLPGITPLAPQLLVALSNLEEGSFLTISGRK